MEKRAVWLQEIQTGARINNLSLEFVLEIACKLVQSKLS